MFKRKGPRAPSFISTCVVCCPPPLTDCHGNQQGPSQPQQHSGQDPQARGVSVQLPVKCLCRKEWEQVIAFIGSPRYSIDTFGWTYWS